MASPLFPFDFLDDDPFPWTFHQQLPAAPGTLQAPTQNTQLPALRQLRGFHAGLLDQHLNSPSFFGDPQPSFPPPVLRPLSLQAPFNGFLPSFPPPSPATPGILPQVGLRPNLNRSNPRPPHAERSISSFLDLPPLPGLELHQNPLAQQWNFADLASPLRQERTSDDYLQAFATGDFSSPSLPPASPLPPQLYEAQLGFPAASRSRPDFATDNASRRTTQLERSRDFHQRRAEEFSQALQEEAGQEEEVSRDITPTSSDAMPTLRKRTASSTARAGSEGPSAKRRRGATAATAARPKVSPKRLPRTQVDDDPFASENEEDGEDVVNLVDDDEASFSDSKQSESKHEPDNRIKLGSFQCVICMDDVKDLTVTHCGHLFCSECLHSSLHIDESKKICPICRQKIDVRRASRSATSRAPTKSYFALELKLMTKTRMGKRPVGKR